MVEAIIAGLIVGNIALTYCVFFRLGRVISTTDDHGRRIVKLERTKNESFTHQTVG